jgi:hypothetical protein
MLNDIHVAQTILPEIAHAQPALAAQVSVVNAYLNGIVAARLNNPQRPWRKLARAKSAPQLVRKGGR